MHEIDQISLCGVVGRPAPFVEELEVLHQVCETRQRCWRAAFLDDEPLGSLSGLGHIARSVIAESRESHVNR